jgi:hypothetical protein
MQTPSSGRTTAAQRANAKSKNRESYPFGRALARTQYFELQRGIELDRSQAPKPCENSSGKQGVARNKIIPTPLAKNYFAAAKSVLKTLAAVTPAIGLPVWTELGPRLIPHGQTHDDGSGSSPAVSGRCNGLYIDPVNTAHLVLSSAGGGLWESRDTGQTWRPLTDALATLSMGAIAYAPSSPNIVYAGTGEGDSQIALGIGLLRSTDAGGTWTALPNVDLSGQGVYDLAVDPLDPSHLWIATTHGLFESNDAGLSVTFVLSGPCWSVGINLRNPTEVLACTARGLFERSGNTWQVHTALRLPVNAPLIRLEIAFAPSSPSVAYVAAATQVGESEAQAWIWRRATSAGNFQAMEIPQSFNANQGWYDWCLSVSPDNADEVYWGGVDLYRGQRNNGQWRWRNISRPNSGDSIHADQHHLAIDPVDPSIIYACNDGGIFRSPDRGITWRSLNPGLGITEFEFLAVGHGRHAGQRNPASRQQRQLGSGRPW